MVERDNLWTDENLFHLLKGGDRYAFNIIYNKYVTTLYLSAYAVLRDEDLSKDIVQEVFVQLWIRKEKSNIISLKSYLLSAVRYKVLKAIQAHSKKVFIDDGELEKLGGITIDTDKLNEDDINRLLDLGIAALPERCREIFTLSRKNHLSHKEIADQLGITSKTVENQMTIALHRLRIVLGDFLFWTCVLIER